MHSLSVCVPPLCTHSRCVYSPCTLTLSVCTSLCTHCQCVYPLCTLTLDVCTHPMHSWCVYLPYAYTLGVYTFLVHSLSVCIPHCALALGICTYLLSLRPQTHLSQQHSVPDTDVGEDRHSTLSVPFNTGREDRLSCLHLVNQREVPQGCLCNSLWEGVGGAVAHSSSIYPASTLWIICIQIVVIAQCHPISLFVN